MTESKKQELGNNYQKLNQTTNPGGSQNTKKDKYQNNYYTPRCIIFKLQ